MNKIEKIITIFFSILIITSYFFGFFFQENSIGSGGYNGDLVWMWKNFEIFKNDLNSKKGFFSSSNVTHTEFYALGNFSRPLRARRN